MLPQTLGPFEIAGILGEGGSAIVYAARDGQRDLALKVLHPEQHVDAQQVARFLDEAERMRRVEHRCLVQILGAGMLPGGRPYIAMPRLEGQPLSRRLERGPIPLPDALALFEGVAGAVDALHLAGLLHRDIKPENVFLCEAEGGSGQRATRLVLLDLGIARDTAANPSTTTRAGLMRGTPAYMAPERLFGQPASVRSDVYELALLFYLMLTAHLPWEEGDPSARLSPTIRPGDQQRLPRPLVTTILGALHADLNQRCKSVPELLARLRSATQSDGGPSVSQQLGGATLESNYARSASGPPIAPASAERRAFATQTTTTGSEVPAPRRVLPWVAVAAVAGFASAGAVYQLPHLRSAPPVAHDMADDTTHTTSIELTPTATPSVTVAPPPTTSPLSASASASGSAVPTAMPSASTSPVAIGAVKEGVLPASVIEGRVRARMAGMQACVHGEAEQPGFQGGRVTMNFWIGLDGSVTSAKGHGELLSPVVVQCVLAQLRTVKFPPPTGGPVNVIFPIRFTPPTPQK